MRTVKIKIDPDTYEAMSAHVGGYSKINDAIGYLATWAMASPRYAFCHIRYVDEGELMASYHPAEGEQARFVLAAIWHDDHWGFHS